MYVFGLQGLIKDSELGQGEDRGEVHKKQGVGLNLLPGPDHPALWWHKAYWLA